MSDHDRYVRGSEGQFVARVRRLRSRVILEDLGLAAPVPLGMTLSKEEAYSLAAELNRVADEIGGPGELYDRLHPPSWLGR